MAPPKEKGKNNDLEFNMTAENSEAAKYLFKVSRQRLLHPHRWHELAGWASASFVVVDATGEKINRTIQPGDYIRIDVPGPGPSGGDGYDWVIVHDIKDETNEHESSVELIVHPSGNPENMHSGTAHFFKKESSSTFKIVRSGKELTAYYHGRNEVINTDADTLKDKLRNAVLAVGAFLGFSELQWMSLIKGFLKEPLKEETDE